MAAKEGYCVKCKAKKEMKEPVDIVMKNGRPGRRAPAPIAEPRCSRSASPRFLARYAPAPPGMNPAALGVCGAVLGWDTLSRRAGVVQW